MHGTSGSNKTLRERKKEKKKGMEIKMEGGHNFNQFPALQPSRLSAEHTPAQSVQTDCQRTICSVTNSMWGGPKIPSPLARQTSNHAPLTSEKFYAHFRFQTRFVFEPNLASEILLFLSPSIGRTSIILVHIHSQALYLHQSIQFQGSRSCGLVV